MPEHDIRIQEIGNGRKPTAVDRDSNSLADKLAKLAVEEHRVPPLVLTAVNKHCKFQEDLIRWIGTVGVLANHSEGAPTRDIDASRKAGLVAS